ncbi:M28 family peptidase [Herbiconiux liangxiaofengii]|uniref:M28 family peptidase n=1 Tax=Herbiconiux liangxiaofengii TaxID=3342795 RepID=UPI0035B95D10
MIAGVAGFGSTAVYAVDPAELEDRVTVDAVVGHLQALQSISDSNGGSRAIGTEGYELSGQYVESVLREAGYDPVRQDFQATSQTIDAFSISLLGITSTNDAEGELQPATPERIPMEFTPSTGVGGIVDAELVAPATPLGCDADAWNGVDVEGSVALVSRGTCAFSDKAIAAGAAGAVAILVYNSEEGALSGTYGAPTDGLIPGVGLTQAEGQAALEALADGPVTVDLTIEQTTTVVDTFNIIAQTPTGRTDNVVMLGAHLDSVPAGPGINDNGSGSAAILETAVQLAQSGELNNAVRFAWWGAEEVGLVGSTEYVYSLEEAELAKIATYLNFDMVASPNYIIGVYDADQSDIPADPSVSIPEGSIATEAAFNAYFDSVGQVYEGTEFDGRSDYQAFIDNGVPASGLFTGADAIKTAAQVQKFGGTEGVDLDPNYHSAGDRLENISTESLGIMLGAIASVTGSLANDTFAINGVAAPTPAPTPVPAPVPSPSGPGLPVTAPPAGDGRGALAATGADTEGALAAVPLAVLVLGAGIVLTALRRRAANR